MTKVLALVTFKVFPPQMGGQKGVVYFYKHLKNLLLVTIAVSKDNEKAPADWDVQTVLFPNKKMFLNPFVLRKLKRIIQQKGIEVIIAEHSYTGWVAWMLMKITGNPFILHSHNIEALRFRLMNRKWWRLYWFYEKWIHQKSDHNFFISVEDQTYAIQNFRLLPQKCSVITYGIEVAQGIHVDKKAWLQSFHLKGSETIFYFNGTLDYKPNYDAVNILLTIVAPMISIALENFIIVVSGNRAPATLIAQMNANPHFLYVGFAQDAAELYALADVFVNPVTNNSGVKTKVIEAVGSGCHVVSTRSGASGIEKDLCDNNLNIAEDHNWQQFTDLMLLAAATPKKAAPKSFYDTYLWNNIAAKAAATIRQVAYQHDHE